MDNHIIIILVVIGIIAALLTTPGRRRFRNPANSYEESIGMPGLWCLLFGCFYFAVKGIWTHAVVALFAAILTFGISWLIYPFFARKIVETHYLRKGWIPVK
jgi:hypothetical protein